MSIPSSQEKLEHLNKEAFFIQAATRAFAQPDAPVSRAVIETTLEHLEVLFEALEDDLTEPEFFKVYDALKRCEKIWLDRRAEFVSKVTLLSTTR